jgi:hypothetical protein
MGAPLGVHSVRWAMTSAPSGFPVFVGPAFNRVASRELDALELANEQVRSMGSRFITLITIERLRSLRILWQFKYSAVDSHVRSSVEDRTWMLAQVLLSDPSPWKCNRAPTSRIVTAAATSRTRTPTRQCLYIPRIHSLQCACFPTLAFAVIHCRFCSTRH